MHPIRMAHTGIRLYELLSVFVSTFKAYGCMGDTCAYYLLIVSTHQCTDALARTRTYLLFCGCTNGMDGISERHIVAF